MPKTKTLKEYTQELIHTQDLIDQNLTRLAKCVARIQRLRQHENYVWNKISSLKVEK